MSFLIPELIILSVATAFLFSFLDELEDLRKLGKPFACPLCMGFWFAVFYGIGYANPFTVEGIVMIADNAIVAAPLSLLLYLMIDKLIE